MNNFFISLLLPISLSFAAGTNRTIDDGLGDVVTGLQVEYLPLYSPNNTAEPFWKHEDQCDGCAIMPDVTKAFDGTWTATTYVPAIEYMSAGLRFNGTAIYIYLILSNYPANTSLVSRTVCDFRLDGSVVGAFDHEMDGTSNFEYNTLAYSNESLSDEEHIFLIETTGSESSYVVFDYAIYTSNDDSQYSSHSRALSSHAVAGIVLGVLVFAVSITCGAYFLYRRCRPRSLNNTERSTDTGILVPFNIFHPFDRSTATKYTTTVPMSFDVDQEVIESRASLLGEKHLAGQVVALQVQVQRLEEQHHGGSQGSRAAGSFSPMDHDGSVTLQPIRREDDDAPPRYMEYHPYNPSGGT